MKFTVEQKPTPTFKQYVDSGEATIPSKHSVERIMCNVDWKTITFFSEAFKLNLKLPSKDEYLKTVKKVTSVLNKDCKCALEIESKSVCHINLDIASDADESAMQYESNDTGWVRTR